jgi:hypothetical protein
MEVLKIEIVIIFFHLRVIRQKQKLGELQEFLEFRTQNLTLRKERCPGLAFNQWKQG